MRKLAVLWSLGVLVACVLSSAAAHAKGEAEALSAAAAAWMTAYEAKDAAAVAKVYAEDGMLLPPNMEVVQGREGITKMWNDLLTSGMRLVLENQEVKVEGKLGYRMGLFKMLAADGTQVDEGKYIEVWMRSGKEWMITRDIWNSSVPVPVPVPGH